MLSTGGYGEGGGQGRHPGFARNSLQTPTQRHYWWGTIMELQLQEQGVDDHPLVCEIRELVTTADQLNVF